VTAYPFRAGAGDRGTSTADRTARTDDEFRAGLREYLDREIEPLVDERDADGPMDRDELLGNIDDLNDLGVGFDPRTAREYFGDLPRFAVASEELSRVWPSLNVAVRTSFPALFVRFASGRTRDGELDRLERGECIGCLAVTEPSGGSDTSRPDPVGLCVAASLGVGSRTVGSAGWRLPTATLATWTPTARSSATRTGRERPRSAGPRSASAVPGPDVSGDGNERSSGYPREPARGTDPNGWNQGSKRSSRRQSSARAGTVADSPSSSSNTFFSAFRRCWWKVGAETSSDAARPSPEVSRGHSKNPAW